MLFVFGYLAVGVVAYLVVSVAGCIIAPALNGFDLDSWFSLLEERGDEDKFESPTELWVFIACLTFLWPIEVVYMVAVYLPEMAGEYKARFDKD